MKKMNNLMAEWVKEFSRHLVEKMKWPLNTWKCDQPPSWWKKSKVRQCLDITSNKKKTQKNCVSIICGWGCNKSIKWYATQLSPLTGPVGISGLPRWLSGKESARRCRRCLRGSIPGLERWPGEGHGNLLQYSCLEDPMDRGTWWDV